MATRRTSLGFCLICTEPPYPDGDCDCAVDMRVCDLCGRGPTDPLDHCGEPDCYPVATEHGRAYEPSEAHDD